MALSPVTTAEEFKVKIQLAIEAVNTQNGKTVRSLYDLADELDKAQRKMNIAKTSFASGGIVAAGLTIAGIACAPATLGASLGLSIAGVTLGFISGAGGLSTELANEIINAKVLNKAQQEANIYHQKGHAMLLLMDNMKKQYGSKFKTFFMDTVKRKLKPNLFEKIPSYGTTAAKLMAKFNKTGTKGLKAGGIALCALTIPLNVYAIVTNSIKIHKRTPSDTAEEIRRIAEELKDKEARSDEVQNLRRRVEEMERNQEKNSQIWDEAKKKIEEDITDEMELIAIEYECVRRVFLKSRQFALIVEAILALAMSLVIGLSSGNGGWLSYIAKCALAIYDMFLFIFELFPLLYGYNCVSRAKAIWQQQTYAIEHLIPLYPRTPSRGNRIGTTWSSMSGNATRVFDDRKFSNQNLFWLLFVILKCMLTMYILFGSYDHVPEHGRPDQHGLNVPKTSLMIGLLFPLSVIPIEPSDNSRPDLYILSLAMVVFMLVKSYQESNEDLSDVARQIQHLPEEFKSRLRELMKRM